MTDEGKKQADAVLVILDKAMREIESFYDCRIVLGSLMGLTSGFAASLYRAGVLDAQGIVEYFSAGLHGALKKEGATPKIVHDVPGAGEVKQ